jgi:porphobilinogen deaminase
MIPSPCQGILGLEIRTGGALHEVRYGVQKEVLLDLLNQLSDRNTRLQAQSKRAFLRTVGSNCHIPIGGYCEIKGDRAVFYGLLGHENGDNMTRKTVSCHLKDAVTCAESLAKSLMQEVGL